MNEDMTITLREKGQYETFPAYIDEIKKIVEKRNNDVIKEFTKKDSEINELSSENDRLKSEIEELKSKVDSLEEENNEIKNNRSESSISETEEELKSSIDELNDVLFDIKNKKNDSRIDKLLSKVEDLYKTQGKVEDAVAEIKDIVSKQEELEDLLTDYIAEAKFDKKEIIEQLTNLRDNQSNYNLDQDDVSFEYEKEDNIEEPTEERVVDNPFEMFNQEKADIPEATPVEESVINPLDQINNDLQSEEVPAAPAEETPVEDTAVNPVEETPSEEPVINPFDQVLNANIDQEVEPTNEPTPVVDNAEVPSMDGNNMPIGESDSETITPDASVIDSIMPQGTVVEENTPQEAKVIPFPVANAANENEVSGTPEKVEGVEEAPTELTETAKSTMRIDPDSVTKIKAVKAILNFFKGKKSVAEPQNISSLTVKNAEMSDEFSEYYETAFEQQNPEQSMRRAA